MPALRVSVIILTWNGRRYLADCLDSLAAQVFRDFETILVDNGSTDGSAEYMRESYPWVRLVELPENVGFAEGNNRGLAVACGEFIVTLNNDTKADRSFLAELVRAAEADPQVGMVAAKMLSWQRPGIIDAAGLKIARNGLGYNIGVGEEDRGQHAAAAPFGPCGGAALYRREMIVETGFFDPDFFAYYEDFDLAWRGRLAGWRAAAAPGAAVLHLHSATGGRASSFKVFHTHRNKWYVILKNWPRELILRNLAAILAVDLAALVLAALRGRGGSALWARVDLLRRLPELLRKRGQVQALTMITPPETAALFSAGENPLRTFLRKMRER